MRSTEWWRPFVNGVAVLLGILTAFGIQAWWDVRQERVTIAGHLEILAVELGVAEAGFREHTELLNGQDRTIRDVLALAAATSPSNLQLDSLVWILGPFVPFEPAFPALRALDVAGLGAIQSDEVRTAIVRYQDFLGVDLEEQASMAEYWRGEISPYWDELFDVRAWIDYAGAADELEDWLVPDLIADDLPRPSLKVSHDHILSDRRFLNQMSRRVIRSWRIRSRHVHLVEEGAVLRELLLDTPS